jgi:hypothetical protein
MPSNVSAVAFLFVFFSIHAGAPTPQQHSEHATQRTASGHKSPGQPRVLRNEDIVEMLKLGISNKAVITKIGASNCRFDTSPKALDGLKRAGVPDEVVLAMLQAPLGSPTGSRPDAKFLMNSTEAVGDLTEAFDFTGADNALVRTIYDNSKRQTLVHVYTTEAGVVHLVDGPSATALVHLVRSGGGFVCRGERVQCTPTTVEIIFVASTSDWQFSADRQAHFFVDGTPLDAGTFSWDGRVNSAGHLTEFIDIDVSPGILSTIADAKQVEVQLGLFQFNLLPQNVAGLAALADHLTTATSK